jgi:Mn-dependent DtxR family transcriptional regulator
VIGFLLHATVGDPDTVRECTVVLPATKQVLASRLNLTPETFSRVLRGLSADGLITVDGRRITLHDVPRLADRLVPVTRVTAGPFADLTCVKEPPSAHA